MKPEAALRTISLEQREEHPTRDQLGPGSNHRKGHYNHSEGFESARLDPEMKIVDRRKEPACHRSPQRPANWHLIMENTLMPTKPILRSSDVELQNWTRNYSVEETLATGKSIRIRTSRPEDRGILLDHLEHLSPASLRSRFFTIKENFTEQLAQLASVDFGNMVVLLATSPTAGDEQVKGFAAYALLQPSSSVAEVAITVADVNHDHGIGTLLLEHLTRIALRAGIAVLEASVLSQNRAALAVLAHRGFRAESYEDPNVVHFKRTLADPLPQR